MLILGSTKDYRHSVEVPTNKALRLIDLAKMIAGSDWSSDIPLHDDISTFWFKAQAHASSFAHQHSQYLD